MNDLKIREVQEVLMFCSDNLTEISEAIKDCYQKNAEIGTGCIYNISIEKTEKNNLTNY